MPTLEVSEDTYGKILEDLKEKGREKDEKGKSLFREAAGSWGEIDAESFKKKTFETRERSSSRKVDL